MSIVKKEIIKINSNLGNINQEFMKLEQLSNEAIEQEDYEAAGEIEDQINYHKKMETEDKEKLDKLNKEFIGLRERELISYSVSSKAFFVAWTMLSVTSFKHSRISSLFKSKVFGIPVNKSLPLTS